MRTPCSRARPNPDACAAESLFLSLLRAQAEVEQPRDCAGKFTGERLPAHVVARLDKYSPTDDRHQELHCYKVDELSGTTTAAAIVTFLDAQERRELGLDGKWREDSRTSLRGWAEDLVCESKVALPAVGSTWLLRMRHGACTGVLVYKVCGGLGRKRRRHEQFSIQILRVCGANGIGGERGPYKHDGKRLVDACWRYLREVLQPQHQPVEVIVSGEACTGSASGFWTKMGMTKHAESDSMFMHL